MTERIRPTNPEQAKSEQESITIPTQEELSDIEKDLISKLRKLLQTEDTLYRKSFSSKIKINNESLEEIGKTELTDKILAIHKMLFLTGGDEDDVITAKDPWGNFIYTKLWEELEEQEKETGKKVDISDSNFRNKYPLKEGEIQEARSAISAFIQKVENRMKKSSCINYERLVKRRFMHPLFGLPETLSEIADIFWNITNIDEKDDIHFYTPRLKTLSNSLGFSYEESLQLALKKYNLRFIENKGKKNIRAENLLLASMIRKGEIPIPNLGQLSIAAGDISIIRKYVESRLGNSVIEVKDVISNS